MTTSNSTVRTVRHPLALDECRAKCQPYLWNGPDGMDWEVGRHAEEVGGGGEENDVVQSSRRDVPTDVQEVCKGCFWMSLVWI